MSEIYMVMSENFMTLEDTTKPIYLVLNNVASEGATETAESIKTKYESNADTNAFTDAEKTNLANQSGTNTGDMSDADVVAAVNADLGNSDWQVATSPAGSQYQLQFNDGANGFAASANLTTNVYGLLEIDQGNQTNKYALHIHNLGDGTTGIRIDHRRWGYADLAQASIVNGNYKLTDGFTNTYGKLWSTAGTGDTQGLYVFKNGGAGADSPVLVTKGMLAQTANLFEARKSDETIVSSFNKDGHLRIDQGLTSNAFAIQVSNIGAGNSAFSYKWALGEYSLRDVGGKAYLDVVNRQGLLTKARGSGDTDGLFIFDNEADATSPVLVTKGHATQSANLFEAQQDDGTIVSSVDASGNLTIGAGQTSSYLKISDAGGTDFYLWNGAASNTRCGFRPATINKYNWFAYNDGSIGLGGLTNVTACASVGALSTTKVNFDIKMFASQTANAFEVKDSTDAVLASIDASGNLTANSLELGNNISLSSPSNAVFDVVAFSNALARFNGYSELRLKDSIKISWGTSHADTGVADTTIERKEAGVIGIQRLNISNIPTSATGLSSGDVWSDGGTLKIVT